MKTIGILGGMSWESSVEYERIINTEVRERLGGVHSADLLIRSYDFDAIEELQEAGEWEAAGRLLGNDAARLERAGAELIVLATNTMHKVAPQIEAAISIPFLHIADATADAVRAAGIETIALLGTRYTMEQDFYRGRLAERGLKVLVPDEPDRTFIHDVIFEELVRGRAEPSSKHRYLQIIDRLQERGAEGVIAGCTEIELLVTPDDVEQPYFPTARIHAIAAVDFALAQPVDQ
ncbi:MAG: aspartate/glutamate racemase family protein [Acidimicrobiia bacterium]|nr:aspartate/glutamate racemase family protein [Acidimicrobiia bacterium]